MRGRQILTNEKMQFLEPEYHSGQDDHTCRFRNVDTALDEWILKKCNGNHDDEDDGVTVGDDNEGGGVLCVVFCRSRGKPTAKKTHSIRR